MLKFYYDLLSQPARALYLFLKLNKVDFVDSSIALRKGEHFSEEYKAVNPFQKVPFIDHDGFKLSESIAIVQYLCSALPNIADNWLPKDVKQRAKVLEYLAWQGSMGNLRHHGSYYFRKRILERVSSEAELASSKEGLNRALSELEDVFLLRGQNKFVNGLTDVSLADLFAVCELEQPIAAGYDFRKERPRISTYMETVSQRCGTMLYADAHQFLWKIREKVLQAKI